MAPESQQDRERAGRRSWTRAPPRRTTAPPPRRGGAERIRVALMRGQ